MQVVEVVNLIATIETLVIFKPVSMRLHALEVINIKLRKTHHSPKNIATVFLFFHKISSTICLEPSKASDKII